MFTGKELDEATGLYYYGARYYDPRTSLWQSADPILTKYLPERGQDPGMTLPSQVDGYAAPRQDMPGIGGVYTGQNLNLYAYTHQNPVRYTDPDGQQIRPNFDCQLYGLFCFGPEGGGRLGGGAPIGRDGRPIKRPSDIERQRAADKFIKLYVGITKKDGLKRTNAARKKYNVKEGTRNVAVADVEITGREKKSVVAISGQKSPDGTVPSPKKRLFKTKDSGAMTRKYDTEVKILEDVASDLDRDSTGLINLFTEKEPCPSCGGKGGVIDQFRKMFPNIKLNVTDGR